MGQRRMFSNRIANSARFLQMPAESQLLYFHMILRADDDGVVECYPVLKLLGLALDNFKILVAKSFIRQLNEDQVVVITDWLEHNTIRADRKIDSIYKNLLPPDIKTIEAKPRSDVKDNSKRIEANGQSTVSPRAAQVKLSQVKLSQYNNSVENNSYKNEINKIAQWAFERASVNPSLTREKFYEIVARAIERYGYEKVYAAYAEEENAITFLTNLKFL